MARNVDGSVKFDTKIDTQEFKSDVDKLKSYSKRAFASIGVAAAGIAVGAATVGISFESAFAGVKKTVNATEAELNDLKQGIRDMAKEIPIAANEIAGIAEAAGQLGIETRNIESFTRVMADLGVATNLTGEEAASTLAKFANITQMPQEKFANLGSTIVALGNNLATTEADIAAMSLRLAGAGSQIGLTEAQILSFSAALSSVGIEAEAGGSAFSRLMTDMQLAVETGSADLKKYASVAGMTGEQFKTAFKDNAANAIIEFVKGLNNTERNGKSATAVLSDMGITEIRLSDALKRAAGASDVFADAIKLGNDAWEENNALTKEAEQRYATTESKLKILGNQAKDLGITVWEAFSGSFGEAIDFASEKVEELSDSLESGKLSGAVENVGELFGSIVEVVVTLADVALPPLVSILGFVGENFGMIAAVVGPATAAIIAYKGAVAAANVVTTVATVVKAAHTAGASALSRVTAALTGNLFKENTMLAAKTVAEGAATAATTAHTTAQVALNTAMKANPVGLAVAGATALIGVIVALCIATNKDTEAEKANRLALEASAKANKELKESLEASKKAREESTSSVVSEYTHLEALYSELEALTDANGKISEAEKGRAEYIINTLNEALGTEIDLTKDMTVAYGDAKDKIYELIEAKKAEALADVYKEDYTNALKEQKNAQEALSEAQRSGAETAAAVAAAEKEYAEAIAAEAKAKEKLDEALRNSPNDVELINSLRYAYDEAGRAIFGASEKVNVAKSKHEKFAQEITNAENTLNNINGTIATYEQGMALLAEGKTQDAINTFQNVGTAVSNMGSDTEDGLKQLGNNYQNSLNQLQSAMDTYLKTGSQAAYNQVVASAKQVATARSEYEAAGGEIADGFVETMDGRMDLSGIMTAISETATEVSKKASDLGTDLGAGIINGIDADTGKVKASGVKCAEEAINGFKEGAEVHSPSKKTYDIGIYTDEGMIKGLEDGANKVKTAARSVAKGALQAAADELGVASPAKEMVPVGEFFDEGLAVGIENETGTVENTAAEMAESAIDAAKDVIDRNDVFSKLGESFTKGLKENSEKNTEKFEKALEVLDFKRSFGLSDEDYFAELTRLRDQYLTEGTKEWYKYTEKIYDHQKDSILDSLEWKFDQGIITEREYYQKLEEYRDKYFVKGSEDWQDYTDKIFEYYKGQATDAVEEIGEMQEDLIDTFNDHGKLVREVTVEGWNEDGSDLVWTELNTSTKELDEVTEYVDKLNAAEERLLANGYSEDFVNKYMAKIRDMSVEEGLEYVRLLANANDATFKTHIDIEYGKEETYKKLAASALDDEITDNAAEFKDAYISALEAAGFEVPEGFFDIGKNSAENFEEGFREQLTSLFNPIKETMMALMPGLSFENAGLAAANATFAPVYNFYSSKDTTTEQIWAAQNASERDKLSGGY